MEKLKFSVDKTCRACMSESENTKSLLCKVEGEGRTLSDMLSFITNINIKLGDNLPKQVCNECETILYKTDAFKRRCIENETRLNELINDKNEQENPMKMGKESLVKQEITIQTDITVSPYQCSICLEKYKDLHLLESHVCDCHSIKEYGLFGESALSPIPDDSLDTSMDFKNVDKIHYVEIIKKETADEYESQIGFNNTNTEIAAIEYKQEDKEAKDQKVYCCTCKSIFKKRSDYETHLKFDKCKPNTSKIKKEVINNIQKSPIICQQCDIQFKTVKSYKNHQRRHKSRELSDNDDNLSKHECPMCMRKFMYKSSLDTHIENHKVRASIKFTCNTCHREFKHQAHLDNHILSVHTRKKGFSCEHCMKNFPTQENLDLHKETHKFEKKHQCKFCNKAFYMLSTLTDHIRTHTGEKPFLCSTCGRGFSQKTNLAQHMRRHQGLKPFKCENCEQSFVSKGELQAHTRKHSGAHPFVCDDCGNGFTTSSSLVKHRRTHTGERPYACDFCPMKFAASGTLKNHRRTHTGEKPYQCSYCEKAFVQRQDLVSHIRCHTGERPFVCSNCGQSFRKGSALKTHVKMHMKEPLHLQRDVNLTVLQGVNVLLSGIQSDNN